MARNKEPNHATAIQRALLFTMLFLGVAILGCDIPTEETDSAGPTNPVVSSDFYKPTIGAMGDVPTTLGRSPWVSFAYPHNVYPAVAVEGRVESEDGTPMSDWTESTSTSGSVVFDGLSLTEGEPYLIRLRTRMLDGTFSEEETSSTWIARSGKGSWSAMSTINAPTTDQFSNMVWTGSKLIVWSDNSGTNSGAVYDLASDTWASMSAVGAPLGRGNASAVWTGTEMIVWGGPWKRSGGRYNPVTNTWRSMSTVGHPDGIAGAAVVWTGTHMILWGGATGAAHAYTNKGYSYDPISDSWSTISSVNAPSARQYASAVWTGSKMIVWGGSHSVGITITSLDSGAIYNPSTNSWTSIAVPTMTGPRSSAKAYWTGSEMLIQDNDIDKRGALYNPATNSWRAMSVPSQRKAPEEASYLIAAGYCFSATAWMGTKYFTWGGWTGWDKTPAGGIYDYATNTWSGTNLTGAPPASRSARAFWTGNKVIVWGGSPYDAIVGAIYTPPP